MGVNPQPAIDGLQLADAPLLPAALAVTVQLVDGGRVPAPEVVGAAVATGLVLLRQMLVLAENRTLVRELAARERALAHQALHCPLTGLGNRTMFTTELRSMLERGDAAPVALLFCDLDDFKTVNDTLGHAAGDELLVQVGARLRAAVRPGDTVVRLGGDEFAVLLACSRDEAATVARQVWASFQRPFCVAGRELSMRASIGLADLAGCGVDGLLHAADVAMYQAKRDGKNRIACFLPTADADAEPTSPSLA